MKNQVLKEQTAEDKLRIKETIKRLKQEAQRWKGNPTFMEQRFNERKEQNAQR